MLPKTVRGAVAAAAVLVEEVGKRVVGTAAGLLEKGGIDVTEVERRFGGQFPPSAQSLQTLAEEAVTAGRAGVDLAVGMARGEVDKVFEKVGDQVTKVGVVLAYLESKLREVEVEVGDEDEGARPAQAGPPPAPRAGGLFEDGWERETKGSAGPERIVVDEPVEVDPPVPPNGPAVAAAAPAKKAAARKPAAAKKAAPAAKQPAGKKAAGKKTAVKKTAVKKTATAKRTTAAEKPAEAGAEQPPAKRTATRKTTVRRTATPKKPDA
ncbi:hypothetical protein [Kitasatospora purpeofusca]|uniref:hypothetical protein n=1 Tax=Kitasatospora purpeofusca TaxID=67352 RepID=UPI002A59D9FD|nr:hypothetical protein [Kitasatospora purpeofusca]MDY0810538.1 hypothetical protein [Kitasatospora purpeofusca]